MDSYYVHLKLSNLKRIGSVFRVIEVCVFFIVLSRFSFQFQFPVGEYAKSFFSILLSHRFVFVIGNAIVITLFANSRKDLQSDHNLKPDPTPWTDSSNETTGKGLGVITRSKPPSVSTTSTEGTKYGTERDKRSVTTSPQHSSQSSTPVENRTVQENKLVKTEQLISSSKACFKRSYSECLEVENCMKPRRILRRTVTEGRRGADSGGRCEEWEALEGGGDGMSDEEFRVMVETFIAKQQRSLREEEKMTVVW